MKTQLMQWMNRHTGFSVFVLLSIGYCLDLLHEVRATLHRGDPLDWAFLLTQALIGFLAAAVAGWAVDLIFTKSEEEAGEID